MILHTTLTRELYYMHITSCGLGLHHPSALLTVHYPRGSGAEDSDTLCVALRDVHGELVALWELRWASGPQHHHRHVLQICTSTNGHNNVVHVCSYESQV